MRLTVLVLCAFLSGSSSPIGMKDGGLSEQTHKYYICDDDNPELNIDFIDKFKEDIYEC